MLVVGYVSSVIILTMLVCSPSYSVIMLEDNYFVFGSLHCNIALL